MEQDKCFHNGQIQFRDGQVVCGSCGKELVWIQAKQLTTLIKRFGHLVSEVDGLRGVCE